MKLTIIGAGPGGYETAAAAAKKGIEVTIVSDGPVGGVCLNEGCIPTKALCRNAEVMELLKEAWVYGLNNLSYSFDFKKVISRKNEIVGQLGAGVEFLLKGKNINLVYGKASFKDSHTVLVSGVSGSMEITSDYIIIATGSVAAELPVPGTDLEGVLSSKEILDLDEVPSKLCVIGAGVIGLEFASIFKSFGSEVSVIEYCKDVLPHFDTDVSKRLKQALIKRGISIDTSSEVKGISSSSSSLLVSYIKKGEEAVVEADKVLMAVGRRPNVQSLNLEDIGIEFTSKGIKVDGNMRSSIPHIFAVGDVTGGLMLAHAAVFQGTRALRAITGEKEAPEVDLSIVPAAVFTKPELAAVGLTEDLCKERGIDVKILKSFFRANGKAVTMNEAEGYCKLIVYSGENSEVFRRGQIIGCHILGIHASDIIQEIAALMNSKATVQELQAIIHAHPTLTEVLHTAASSF